MRLSIVAAAAALGMSVATPSALQAQEMIDVGPLDAFTIPETELAFPPTLAGSVREKLIRFGEGDYNIGSTYKRSDSGDVVSLYYYRLAAGSVPVWFDRITTLIESSDRLGNLTRHQDFDMADVEGSTGAAMVRVWKLEGPLRSSGLLLARKGDMLVKLRVSSEDLPPSALAQFMREAMAELAIPFERKAAYAAVSDCREPLRAFGKKVKIVAADDPMDGLIQGAFGSLVGAALREGRAEGGPEEAQVAVAPATYCREDETNGLYRVVGTDDSYLIALQDSGIAVSVGATNSLAAILASTDDAPEANERIYRATIHETTRNLIFPPFNGFPSPGDAISQLRENDPSSIVETAGADRGNITISTPLGSD